MIQRHKNVARNCFGDSLGVSRTTGKRHFVKLEYLEQQGMKKSGNTVNNIFDVSCGRRKIYDFDRRISRSISILMVIYRRLHRDGPIYWTTSKPNVSKVMMHECADTIASCINKRTCGDGQVLIILYSWGVQSKGVDLLHTAESGSPSWYETTNRSSLHYCGIHPQASRVGRPPTTLGSLSMQGFWATDGHLKCTVFLFYWSSHYHIYIFKFVCASRDDYFGNLGETNVLTCKVFTSSCRPWLKHVACLSSLTFPRRQWFAT